MNLHVFKHVDELFHDITTNKARLYCFAAEVSDVRPKNQEVNVTIYFPRDDLSGLINTYTPYYDENLRNPDWKKYNDTTLIGVPHFMIKLTDFVVMMLRGYKLNELELAFVPMKTPAFKELPPNAAAQLSQIFPFFQICIFLLPLYYNVTRLADEKESKAREGMKMMGLTDKVYYIGWFIFNGLITSYISFITISILQMEVFCKSEFFIMLAMLIIYGAQLFGFSFVIVALLPSKKASSTAASILHLSTYYFVFKYKGAGYSMIEKMIVGSFVPNVALSFMLDHLLHVEIVGGTGLTIQTGLIWHQNLNFFIGLLCQVVCSLLWAAIGLYLDKVIPSQFGKAEPWNFLCKRKIKRTNLNLADEQQDQRLIKKGNFEVESEALKRTEQLRIRNLKKVYDNGTVAVHNESMTMYKGQIFALLGHNGAGKTTTISMLTGLLEPTAGSATLQGFEIFDDMDRLRENLGVCPQHNVLFPDLTVREHLEIFCTFKLKSTDNKYEVIRRVDRMIAQLELEDVQFQVASTLSGGQKRKLSVGIALIGDAQIVMLDEPTSGMDTTTRRRFWDIIKLYKKDRIIILTTHYMDEADVLGDKICIMAEGKVQCCGSGLYLKNHFGVGYNLKLTKTDKTSADEVEKFINERIKGGQQLQETQTEIQWQLPLSANLYFKKFFNDLDLNLNKLNLLCYGISITTLEEVFLKIGHGEDDSNQITINKIRQNTADLSKLSKRELLLTEYSISNDYSKTLSSEVFALMKKKVLVQIRDLKSCVIDILFPCILIIGGIYLSQVDIVPASHSPRKMSLESFPTARPFIHNSENFNQTANDLKEFMHNGFSSDIGPGKLWSEDKPFTVAKQDHFFKQLLQMDNYIFDERNTTGPYWSEIFVQQAKRDQHMYSIAGLVNTSQPEAVLASTAYMLQSVIRSETQNPNFKYNFLQGQLPFSLEWQLYIKTGMGLLSSLGFAIAFMMMSDTLIQSLLKEKQLAIKHQILISGGSKVAYWVSHYIVDVLQHGIPATLTCYCIYLFNVNTPQVELLFLMFCLTNPLFIYCLQYLFSNDVKASIFIRVFYFALGGVAPIMMQLEYVLSKSRFAFGNYMKWYCSFVPIYNMNYGFININNRATIELNLKQQVGSIKPLDWTCAGQSLFMLQVAGIASLVLLILIENNIFLVLFRPTYKPILDYLTMIDQSLATKKAKKAYDIREVSSMEEYDFNKKQQVVRIDDQDPFIEEKRVQKLRRSQVKVQNLTKAFSPVYKAVDNLSFALDFGECFALLGITGAGKTTTFKCLCQEEIPDEGELMMSGIDCTQSFGLSNTRAVVGYCPQFDAIYDHLTVYEHLDFYASIKGIRKDYKPELVQRQIRELDLIPYTNVQAGRLSGGNKRKLSCAIALIGNPSIILLDEPSTGVDPQAKRFMWTVISNISTLRKQSTVILTTHSMEEAEALCPKMGIMVNGRFQCFGSAQHIKDKYSDGFDINLKISEPTSVQRTQYLKKLKLKDSDLLYEKDVRDCLQKLELQHIWDNVITEENSLQFIFKKEAPFSVVEVLNWIHIEQNGFGLNSKFTEIFGQSIVTEHFSNGYLFKVQRNNYSIGFVFGVMEEIKSEFSIQEYSATQTTLEQIFNLFARQKGIDKQHSDDQDLQEKKQQ